MKNKGHMSISRTQFTSDKKVCKQKLGSLYKIVASPPERVFQQYKESDKNMFL